MRIVHLSTTDARGGAPLAAYRLHSGLRVLGHDSQMLVAKRLSHDPTVTALHLPLDLLSRVRRRARRTLITRARAAYRRPTDREPFTDDRSDTGAALVAQLPPCDVINLHWVATFVDYARFFETVRTPVVWTLHDMNPFTGGCHYDRGCGKFTQQCGACPQLASSQPDDLSRRIWARKAAALENVPVDRLHVVTPSHWLAGEARRSSLFGSFPVTVIPNGIDTDAFVPVPREVARAGLRLPQDAAVLLFVAEEMGQSRKGFAHLVEALRGLSDVPGLTLVSMGHNSPALDGSIPHLHLDWVDHPRLLALVYSAADLFVIPSMQDNLPNTVLEALACGTPVAGFDVGGIPDMVHPGETGALAPAGDADALCAAMRNLLSHPAASTDMRAACRRLVESTYTLAHQAERYAALYQDVIRG
jgi:glycosyltransferase involved in cell wall biosynthesis